MFGAAEAEDLEDINLPPGAVAELLGITQARLRQLVDEGVAVKASRGSYSLKGCVRGYIRYLQKLKEGTEERAEAATRLTKVRADREELSLEVRRKTLVPAEDVDQALMEAAVSLVSLLDGAAARIASELAGGPELRNQLSDAFREIREEYAASLSTFSGQLREDGWHRAAARKRRTRRVGKKKGTAARKRRARKV